MKVEPLPRSLETVMQPPIAAIGLIRFTVLLPKSVGGVVEIAAITKHGGFRRVHRKNVYPADLNRDG